MNKEFKRMLELAGLTEIKVNEPREFYSSKLQQIFDEIEQGDRDQFQESPPDDPQVIQTWEQAISNAKSNNIQNFATSFVELYYILEEEYETDFGDSITYLIKLCKQTNFPKTLELIKTCIDEYMEGESEDEKQEYFDDFIDDIDN
jgi:hypothetical protein